MRSGFMTPTILLSSCASAAVTTSMREESIKVVEARAPEKAQDDPAKLRRASQLLEKAEQAIAAERWGDAHEALESLHTGFASLQFTKDRSSAIGRRDDAARARGSPNPSCYPTKTALLRPQTQSP